MAADSALLGHRGIEPSQSEPFDWRKVAAGAVGLAAILGSARFGGRETQLYRNWMRNVLQQGAEHTPPGVAEGWTHRLFRAPWWHGAPSEGSTQNILEHGFDPGKMYSKMGLRFGEPAGVSLSANPLAASGFTHQPEILRVWPRVDPKSVLPVWSEEAATPLTKAYLDALGRGTEAGSTKTIRDYINSLRAEGGWPLENVIGFMTQHPHDRVAKVFNEALSENLQRQGVQGLLYNPHRFGEHELRVLDPKRAVPIEARAYTTEPGLTVPGRFRHVAMRKANEYVAQVPGRIRSLSDLYKTIPEEKITGGYRPPVPVSSPHVGPDLKVVSEAIFEYAKKTGLTGPDLLQHIGEQLAAKGRYAESQYVFTLMKSYGKKKELPY